MQILDIMELDRNSTLRFLIMFLLFFVFSHVEARNLTYEGVNIKFGLDREGYGYFGSRFNPTNAINFTFNGHLYLPEAIRYGNRTFIFKMICERAFANTSITAITLPTTLQWIGESAFENVASLTTIDAKSTNLSIIDEKAFRNCSNLKEFSLPYTIKMIGKMAFQYTPIKSIVNANYTLLDDYSFSNNHEITSVDLSNSSIKIISTSLFENCTKLTNIILPSTLFWIKSFAFARTSIIDVKIPQTLTLMHKFVFTECLNIKHANLENSPIKCVSDGLYANCTNLESVILPKICYWIGAYSFSNTSLKEIFIPNICYNIGEYCFSQCQRLTSVDMSKSVVESLSDGIFYNCTNLVNIKNSPVLQYIGAFPLFNTKVVDLGPLRSLQKLNSSSFVNSMITTLDMINSSIEELPEKLFFEHQHISNISVSNYTKRIGAYAFSGTLMVNITLPLSVSLIGEGVFMNCSNLFFVCLNTTNIQVLMPHTFENCEGLVAVRVPKHLHTLKFAAFRNCTNLECVFGSKRLRIIGPFVFYNCSSLTQVNFSRIAVHYIDESAFEYCRNLTNFTMSYQTIGTGPKAFAHTSIEKIEFFHNIGTFCFAHCTKLVEVNMTRSSATALNSAIFDQCTSLKVVHLPKKITFIGPTVFRGCTSLEKVFHRGTKNIESGDIPNSVKVYVTEDYTCDVFGSHSVIVIERNKIK